MSKNKFPYECINCGKTFMNEHFMVTNGYSRNGIRKKELFCCPACEDSYMENAKAPKKEED